MEQSPVRTAPREYILHIPIAQYQLRSTVNPVVLEDRCVRMIEPLDKDQQGQPQQKQQHHDQQPQQEEKQPSSTETAYASKPTPQEATLRLQTSIFQDQKNPPVGTASKSDVEVVVIPAAVTIKTTTTTSETAAETTAETSSKSLNVVGKENVSQTQLAEKKDASSQLKKSETSISPASKTPEARALPIPSSPLLPSSSLGRRKEESTEIVGGKHPLVEDCLTLTVPDLFLLEEVRAASSSPRTDSDGSASSWSQPHTHRSRSATTTSKLSTREQLIPGDQPFRDKSHSEEKIGVQFSLSPSPKRDVAHVMEFFQEQEKNLQERFLSLPKNPPRKQRSPSPNTQQKLGLEHLDNLVKLMQQLTSLKDENSRLRKRCDYLESTKNLLQAKQGISPEGETPSPLRYSTTTSKQKHHHHHLHHLKQFKSVHATSTHPTTGIRTRQRLSSTDGVEYLETVDSSSDQRPKQPKKPLHKRSFSTGSIEIDLLDSAMVDISSDDKYEKGSKSKHDRKHGSKQKSKSSKWARVKKVLTGQKLYEDLNTTIKSLREFGKSSHLRYPTTSAQNRSIISSPRPSAARVYRRSDSIPVFGGDKEFEAQGGHPTYSGYQVMETTEALDLSTDIWMGPPDWWEEYEANKESATSASSDVSSVIEVTTMYLGQKSEEMSTSQTTSTSTSSSSSATTTTTILKSGGISSSIHERLTVEAAMRRRKSSPHLGLNDDDEDDASLLEGLATRTEPVRFLHKSSSCKSAELDLPRTAQDIKDSAKKFHKTAWGRVKDIIHTRKDSMSKRRPRIIEEKIGTFTEPEEASEVDMEALLDDTWHHDLFAEGLLSRSTPKTSPMVIRQSQRIRDAEAEAKAGGSSLTKSMSVSSGSAASTSPGNMDMAALLGRSMSDDFNKKMQEWEELKSKKPSVRASVDDSEVCSLDVVSPPQDLQIVDLKDLQGSIPEVGTESLVTEDSNTSIEEMGVSGASPEEGTTRKKMTESFSRKMQEWERMKYRGGPGLIKDASPEMERKGSKGKKEERQKSKRSREDKEKEKLERQREREMQKVEREQHKLEKEKLRIEKERLRALEREAKLEKMKGRLSQPDSELVHKNPVLSPLAEYKVTADFAHKLHEWELRKGLSHAVSNSVYLEAHKIKSMHQLKEGAPQESVRFTFDPATEPPETGAIPIQASLDSPDDASSPGEKLSELSIDESTTTDECRTTSNIPTLERANAQLLQELRKKEIEYNAVQDEVQSLNDKLEEVKDEHAAEMARFHQELKEGTVSGPVKLEIGELERVMGDVEDKIKVMENFGETMAQSMESAAVGKWQSIEGEENVHTQLMELVAQMRNMLIQATQSEEASQKTSALTNFEVLYSQAMKLQVEMNNLRLSHIERNREIMVIKRQLLLQEVNNLVLQADITRREAELYQFQESKRFSSTGLRRWNTFSGHGGSRHRPQAQIELPVAMTKQKARSAVEKEEKSQRVHEQDIPATSISAPCSPLAKAEAIEELSPLLEIPADLTHPEMSSAPEQLAIDHQQSYMSTSIPETVDTYKQLTTNVSESLKPEGISTSLEVQGSISEEEKDLKQVKETSQAIKKATVVEYKTQFDSLPLQQEIEALRKEKVKVEKGSTILTKQEAQSDPSPDPSTGQELIVRDSPPKTLSQTIPKQSCLDTKPRLQKTAQIIDEDFPTAQSVMECTEHSPLPDHTLQPTTSTWEGGSSTTASPPSPSNLSALPPIADQPRTGSRSPRSPVSKHKLLRRQKEKEETKSRDYSAISPKGSPVAARGKPPLPRQDRSVRHSPSSSPCISERSGRTKSQGDVDTITVPRSPVISRPLQDSINRFDKRSTVCETEDRPIELRKTPSPTLHLPRVGLVSRVRKLKPAAELLEESQRYRSGQSIYATRIMPKYLSKEDQRKDNESTRDNKENVAGSYVQSMVQRLSRESTPARSPGSSRTTSNSSLHLSDTNRPQSEFVSQIVRKLSSSSGPDSSLIVAPLTDLTNGHTSKTESKSSIDPSFIQTEKVKHRVSSSVQQPHDRRSCEVAMVLSSKSSTLSDSSFTITSAVSTQSVSTCYEMSSTTVTSSIPTNHKSMPTLSSQSSHLASSSSTQDKGKRSRTKAQKKDVSFEIEPEFSSLTSASSVFISPSDEEKEECTKRSKEKRKKGESRRLLASLSPIRKGAAKGKMETVEVLCKQSISFDLGVSEYGRRQTGPSLKKTGAIAKSRKPRSWDPSESVAAEAAAAAAESSAPSTSFSTSAIECGDVMNSSAEGEVAPSSPTSTEKKKSKRFLDSNWLQKSKKFFKVSK